MEKIKGKVAPKKKRITCNDEHVLVMQPLKSIFLDVYVSDNGDRETEFI